MSITNVSSRPNGEALETASDGTCFRGDFVGNERLGNGGRSGEGSLKVKEQTIYLMCSLIN